MFTGLVQELGTVRAVQRGSDGVRLTIDTALSRELGAGDSVAVDGVCLTAAAVENGAFTADVMAETLRRSSLGAVQEGDGVNLEMPLRAGDRMGGHVVQGHVDGLGTIRATRDDGFARLLTIAAAPELLRYVAEKGSIAVNGVSLTVASVGQDELAVSLIPETLDRTNLGAAREGTQVNLEVDVLAKYVERLVAK